MRSTLPWRASPAQLPTEEDVGRDVERWGDCEVLIDGLDPGSSSVAGRAEVRALTVEADLTFVRLQRARERFDQRRLAGTVVADDCENLARVELQVRSVQRNDMSVPLDKPVRLEDRSRRAHATLRCVS